MLKLKFATTKLEEYSLQYAYDKPELENEITNVIAPSVKLQGYLTKEQFLKVCKWKTERSKSRCDKNEESLIKDITTIALNHPNEILKIEVLTLLDGILWPTASVFLHFFHNDEYPILDFRALWSLGIEKPPAQYNFEFWWEYVLFCRNLSKTSGLGMRTIDKALWSYSNMNQKRSL